MEKLNYAIIGCGDYVQRWESGPISESKQIQVSSLFDLDQTKAELLQKKVGGTVVDSVEVIFSDADIDVVCLFVPPFVRKGLVEQAVSAGKHIITTKPLGNTLEDCKEIVATVGSQVRMGVFYGRTGNGQVQTCKKVFDSGEIGRLALYKQDWIHHYPTWNDWATDRDKNGGPFMDAMIHNLNLAKYLMGRDVKQVHYFSDNHAHPDLKCNDTEFMKVDFERNGSAHLFITWAADLEIFDNTGNDREHIDLFYMVTDQGWRVTFDEDASGAIVKASKEGQIKTWSVEEFEHTPYDAFAQAIANDNPFRPDIVYMEDALEDIALLKNAEA